MGDAHERGMQWWVRYVIVPVFAALLGGGGLIAYINSMRVPSPGTPKAKVPEAKETVDFYLSSKHSEREGHEAVLPAGQKVFIHWNIQNSHGETFSLTKIDVDRGITIAKQVRPSGLDVITVSAITIDCILEKDDGQGGKVLLGSLRISPLHP